MDIDLAARSCKDRLIGSCSPFVQRRAGSFIIMRQSRNASSAASNRARMVFEDVATNASFLRHSHRYESPIGQKGVPHTWSR